MGAPRKYPEELRERAIRLTVDARKDPARRPSACVRICEQLGIDAETLRGWVTQAEVAAGRPPVPARARRRRSRSWSGATASCGGRNAFTAFTSRRKADHN